MENEEVKISLQYYFSHVVLRNLAFSDTKTFVQNIASDASSMYHFLDYFWDEAKKEEPTLENINDEPVFELSKSKFESGTELVIIKMPEPKFTMEESLRYFTLEKSESPFDSRPINLLSEWELHGDHFHNSAFGEVDNLREGYLSGVIESICKDYPAGSGAHHHHE